MPTGYFDTVNDNVLVMTQIESIEGVGNMKEVCEVDAIGWFSLSSLSIDIRPKRKHRAVTHRYTPVQTSYPLEPTIFRWVGCGRWPPKYNEQVFGALWTRSSRWR